MIARDWDCMSSGGSSPSVVLMAFRRTRLLARTTAVDILELTSDWGFPGPAWNRPIRVNYALGHRNIVALLLPRPLVIRTGPGRSLSSSTTAQSPQSFPGILWLRSMDVDLPAIRRVRALGAPTG